MKFELDKGERARFDLWNTMHLETLHHGQEPYGGAIGGRISFIITGTSIGQILGVECCSCKSTGKPREVYSECLTDFSDW